MAPRNWGTIPEGGHQLLWETAGCMRGDSAWRHQPRRCHCQLRSHLSRSLTGVKWGDFTVGSIGVSFEKLPVEGDAENAGKAE